PIFKRRIVNGVIYILPTQVKNMRVKLEQPVQIFKQPGVESGA
ncbi:10692_t:CDS:1, partial [Ambispora leptoticha]